VIDTEDDIAGVPAIIAGRRTLFIAAGTVNAYVDLSENDPARSSVRGRFC
jgi:hypothetical protein